MDNSLGGFDSIRDSADGVSDFTAGPRRTFLWPGVGNQSEEAMREFRGVDFYRMDELLSEEERMVRDTVRSFVSEKVVPTIDRHFEEATFPMDLVPEMADLGLFGTTLPEEYGCAGMNNVAYGLVMQELERGDSALRSFASVQGALVMYPIYTFGTEEQRRFWLPKLAAGEKIGCFGLTEPDFGSNPAGMATTARTAPDGYVLNGTIADVAVVWARLDEGAIRGFLVEKGTKGFSAPEQKRKFSLRASVTSELILQDVHVAKTAILPGVEGLKGPLSCLTQARYGIAWGVLGAAQACLSQLLEYTHERVLFGRTLAHNQAIQIRLAEMARQITTAQLLALQLGRLKDSGQMTPA